MLRALSFCLLWSVALLGFSATSAKVYSYHLKNGLTVLVKPDHRAPVALVEIWYHVGSSYEPNGITGISHMLEHMMFRGTRRVGDGQLHHLIMRVGGVNNAMTSYDTTAYYEFVAKQYLPLCFRLEADRMKGLLINPAKFAKEKQVVLEEQQMRIANNPISYAYERYMAAANIANPYHHPVIGWVSDIKQLTSRELYRWYYQWYQPNNATVVVVGDVDPGRVERLAQEAFGKIKAGQVPTRKQHPDLAPVGERWLEVRRPAKVPALILGFNVPVIHTLKQHTDAYALEVASGILANGSSGRLMQTLVRDRQIASAISVRYNPYSRLDSNFTILAIPVKGVGIATLQQAILAQLQDLMANPVSMTELARVKTDMRAGYIYSQDSLFNQASALGRLDSVGLPWQLSKDYIGHLEAVTPKQIQAVAKRFFVTKNMTVTVLLPKDSKQHVNKLSLPNCRPSAVNAVEVMS